MLTLVDTSVWVAHLRSGDPLLGSLLNAGEVLCHPWVIGEISCGNLKDRKKILTLLRQLPKVTQVSDLEIFALIEKRKLYGKGVGWVDCALLAACMINQVLLFTYDKRLGSIGKSLGLIKVKP